ncbi:MAG: pyruvate, phosphate dikinase [Planctomycetes bacterium]|nr:pyruvate, phosphate dikinase [Planctomycetota bacterium]
MPDVYDQLEAVRVMLEVHYKDMQDLEFTIERGTLYMLQCRTGKRSPAAAFKIAVDQATKGLMTAATAKRLVQRKHLPKKYLAGASKPIITRDEAIRRITAEDIERLFFPVIDPSIPMDDLNRRALGEGIGAVPGAACGEVVFSAERAQQRVSAGATVILVRKETSPEDVGGMHVAVGILTATGGKTSHAAVVARGWGKCCIVGCGDLQVDYDNKCFTLNDTVVHEGDPITLDGSSGRIYRGEIGLDRPTAPPEYDTLLGWCDKRRRLGVRANADTPADAAKAVELGAEGIGLCRTEHMFFDPSEPERLRAMREMILADSEDRRCAALAKLLPYQRKDFEGLFTAMDAKPVTIRLLDPPLHEFLPQHDNPEGQQALVDEMNESAGFGSSGTGGNGATAVSGRPPIGSGGGDGGTEYAGDTAAAPAQSDTCVAVVDEAPQAASAQPCAPGEQTGPAGVPRVTLEDVRRRVDQLHETNPMLGHRGCRLCITYPEILEMQVRAIIEAAVACTKRGIKVLPEIMIPLTIDAKELAILTDRTRAVADAILKEHKSKIKYLVGTMIETPRAALVADKMAEVAEFFSFGTNDLTQMAMGLSRDDAGRFLPEYVDESKAAIFPADPFQTIDVDGVGLLVQLACKNGRESRPGLKLGICGEHGGDPASVIFCDVIGLDYVSCSPFRVPIARLAAAQAVIDGTPEPRASARATLRTPGTKAGTTRKTGSRSKTTTKKTKAKPKVKAKAKVKVKAKAKTKVRPKTGKKSKTKAAAKKRRTR